MTDLTQKEITASAPAWRRLQFMIGANITTLAACTGWLHILLKHPPHSPCSLSVFEIIL